MESRARILLVEDDPMDAELALDAFRQAELGHRMDVARTGEDALDYVFGRGAYADREDHRAPDLILLDLKMSGTQGHEVLRRLKETSPHCRIPLVVLTSSREHRDLAYCYDHGANSYLIKPVLFAEFTRLLARVLDYWLSANANPPMEEAPGLPRVG